VSSVDDMIKEFILDKYVASNKYSEIHGPRDELKVLESDVGRECWCYSEYTRDDEFVMKAKIQTLKRVIEFEWGTHSDIPQFIQDLEKYKDFSCGYDED